MLRVILATVILTLFPWQLFAHTINCYGGFTRTVTLPSSTALDNITAGLANDTTHFRKLYTYDYIRFSTTNTQCEVSESGQTATLKWVAFVNSETAPLTYGGNIIFPTSINGIGLSFNDMTFGGEKSLNITSTPTVLGTWVLNNTRTLNTKDFNIKVTIWKIPGKLSTDTLDFSSIRLDLGLQAPSSDNFASRMALTNSPAISSNVWTVLVGKVTGSIHLNSGTCDVANRTVLLGTHQGDFPSSWKDATFTVKCSTAWGYGITANMDNDNSIISRTSGTANTGLAISILPRTSIISAIPGTVALASGGATGYGVQLVWGDANLLSSSASVPSGSVIFDTPTVVSSQSFAHGSTPEPIQVKLAARYIPTGETKSPGLANSSIEVLANYN